MDGQEVYARRQRQQQQQLPSITWGFVFPLQHNQKEIKKLKKTYNVQQQ